jgi:hypothetical protein
MLSVGVFYECKHAGNHSGMSRAGPRYCRYTEESVEKKTDGCRRRIFIIHFTELSIRAAFAVLCFYACVRNIRILFYVDDTSATVGVRTR